MTLGIWLRLCGRPPDQGEGDILVCIDRPKARRHCRDVPVVVDRLCAAGRAGGGEKQKTGALGSRSAHLSKPNANALQQ